MVYDGTNVPTAFHDPTRSLEVSIDQIIRDVAKGFLGLIEAGVDVAIEFIEDIVKALLQVVELPIDIVIAIANWVKNIPELINGLLPDNIFPVIPLSSIGKISPNLVKDSLFKKAVAGQGYTIDPEAEFGTSGQSYKGVANGTLKDLVLPERIAVAEDQQVTMRIRLKWADLVSTGNPFRLKLKTFNGSEEGTTYTLDLPSTVPALPGTNSVSWVELSGTWTTPGLVDAIVPVLSMSATATAGNVWWSYLQVRKNTTKGIATIDWIDDLPESLNGVSEFSQTIIMVVMKILTGIPFIGWLFDDLEQELEDWFSDTQATAAQASDAYIIANEAVVDAGTAQTTANTANTTAGDILLNLVEAILGRTPTGTIDTRYAANKIRDDLEENAKAIAAMQARDSGDRATGKVITVDFGNYSNGSLPSIFNVTYTGPGTSPLVVKDGKAQWDKTNNANRDATVIYNVEPMATDHMIIRGTMAAPPEDTTDGGRPNFYALGRSNIASTSRVWARAWSVGSFFQFKGDIGCTIDGVEQVWVTDIPLTWSMNMTVVLGVGNNKRQYQVFSGTKLVYTHTEAEGEVATYAALPVGLGAAGHNKRWVNLADGRRYTWLWNAGAGTGAWSHPNNGTAPLASKLGPDFRYWGSLAQLRQDNSGIPNSGGIVSGCSVADNELPAVVGTTAMMYRSNDVGVTFSGGTNALPNNFFEFIGRESRDIDADPATGTVTILVRGSYFVRGRVNVKTALTSDCNLHIQNNTGSGFTTVSSGAGTKSPSIDFGLEVTDMLHLEPGNILRLAPNKTGTAVSNALNGGTDGKTIFSVTRLPDALAA